MNMMAGVQPGNPLSVNCVPLKPFASCRNKVKFAKRLTCNLVTALVAWKIAHTAPCAESSTSNSRGTPPARVAIKAGRLLNPRTGEVATNAVLVIEGERIATIGAAVPSGVRVIDLSGLTVLPGLVDCHAHILGNPKDESPTADLRMSSVQAALWAVHNLQIWLDHGFTRLRDAGQSDMGYGQLAVRDSVQKGLITGPRIVSAGNFISVSGGHGDADVLAPDQELRRRPNLADTVEEVAIAVRHDLKYGADWIKPMATGGVKVRKTEPVRALCH
jgi:imidazolonepropionase-like amidohydrolase